MMNKEKVAIKRGEIYYADLSPVIGSEQGGDRPVLVIQNDVGNLHSPTVIIAAITTKVTKAQMPTHVQINQCRNSKLRRSTILLEQLRTIDKRRIHQRHRLATLSPQTMRRVDHALKISLHI